MIGKNYPVVIELRTVKDMREGGVKKPGKVAMSFMYGPILLFEPFRAAEGSFWHDLSPLKYHKFKIQAQEKNASVPSE